jgi:hypothetical protein
MTQKVRTSLLVDAAVTGNKIGTTAISTNNIVAGAITGNLIASGAISNAKLAEPNAFEDYFLMGGL